MVGANSGGRFRCCVCGRVFPKGQGIVVALSGGVLAFHSSKCAARFLRLLLDSGSKEVMSSALRLARELESKLVEAQERRAKKI
jgi:hypothetical protein